MTCVYFALLNISSAPLADRANRPVTPLSEQIALADYVPRSV